MMSAYKKSTKLLEEIEVTRKSLIVIGDIYGLTHPETVKLSQQLDQLLNELDESEHTN